MIALTINGRRVEAAEGTTILQAALDAGIDIPHLCYDPRLEPYGACRLCLVEIEGWPEPVTSCTTAAQDGMVVYTDTDNLRELRRTLLELILSDHPRECLTCPKTGACDLQDLAYELKVEDCPPVPHERPVLVEAVGNAVIYRDPELCILCGKCVRLCAELQAVGAVDFVGRGFDTQVAEPPGGLNWDTECELCGQCVDVCPTGALMVQRAIERGRPKDYQKVRTTCPYCGVGCSMELNVYKDEVVQVTADPTIPPNHGNLCVKGRFGYEFIDAPDRLRTPLIRKNGELVEASWDEALDLIARRLTEIRDTYGPDALGFVASARCTNEENYLMQKLARQVIGTHNVDQCARTCHAPSVAGLAMSFGSGAMTNSIEEIRNCDCLLVIGSNTTEAHPVIGLEMKRAWRRGATIIVVDPRRIPLVEMAAIHLQINPGTDIPLLNAMMYTILEEGLEDKEFIAARTEGFEELKEVVMRYRPEDVAPLCGVAAEDIRKAARIYATTDKAGIFYTLGVTEHVCGTDNVRSIANLAMLTGHVGRESTGVNPLRGQNNVQGACDMGALPNYYPGYQKVEDPAARDKFSAAYGRELPLKNGWTNTEMIEQALQGNVKALYVMGEDIVMSEPHMGRTIEACRKLDFLVVHDIFFCETAKYADVVLPATSFAEKDGTFTNTERRVQRVRQAITPRGESKPDWQILVEVARRMGYDWNYEHASEVWDEIAGLCPIFAGIDYARIDRAGIQWPCPSKDHPGTKFLHQGRFTRGLGKFYPIDHRPPAELPDEEYPFTLITGRTLYHYNVGTMTRRSRASVERQPEAFVEISPQDAERLGIRHEDMVRVSTRRGEVTVRAWVTDRVQPGKIWMPFHFAEQPANALTIDAYDNITLTAEYKVCAARLEPVAALAASEG
ncbi:MAG: formate dehydrogenase subunit alpha [Armatimonadetes bacterium]|nr:formate dehydrogenase subunit alpha [Armatimonadota bacterium]